TASETAQLVFEDLRVTPDELLGGEGEGMTVALGTLEAGRVGIASQSVEAARQLTHYAASLIDAGRPCRQEASMAKLFASDMAEKVCSDAIQIHGGYGYVKDFPVERLWRDMRVCRIYEGTSDIQRLVISRELMRG